MSRPMLSLLIPAYNAAWCLPRLLTSAQKQTVPFDEIWVYDDCSTDDTAAVAERHGAKVLLGDINKGCSAGKNALAKHVETEWLHFHDADDELLPNFVELARKWIDRGDRDVVLFAYEYRDNATGELLEISKFDDAQLRADPKCYAIIRQINPFCGLYRRDRMLAAGGYDEDPLVLYNEDVAFHIRMAFAGLSFAADGEVSLINYRVGGSMSAANQAKCAVAHFNVMKKTLSMPDGYQFHAEIGQNLWRISGVLAAHDEWATAKQASTLAASLCKPPWNAGRVWFRILARITPFGAVRLRELLIRTLKPQFRPSSSRH